jgi:hypothetical protein
MNSPQTIEKSLFWQRYVLSHSKQPNQIERVKRAIEKLEAELNQARAK